MYLGPILTATRSLQPFLDAIASCTVVKVVTGHGPAGGWTADSRAALVSALPHGAALIVRTVAGDPSYGKNAQHELPLASAVTTEIAPWLALKPDAWVELGNEPLLTDQDNEIVAWHYRWCLDQTIRAVRTSWPHARLIAPAHIDNHRIRLGTHLDGQERWDQICSDVYRRCDALGIHAYSPEQLTTGLRRVRAHVSASLPVWLTEVNLNVSMPAKSRAAALQSLWEGAGLLGACLYHWCDDPGSDPVHFHANYALDQATIQALTTREEPHTMERTIIAELEAYRRSLGRTRAFIGTRSTTTAITLHWNGPAVAEKNRRGEGVKNQLFADLKWQTDPNWPGAKGGADGLQYHAAVDASGCIWYCRALDAKLWHCGHAVGNNESLSLHLLLGRNQPPTEAQWAATVRLLQAWRTLYSIPVGRVFGHQEWAASECPGPDVMRRLRDYRASGAPAIVPVPSGSSLRRFRVALPLESRATVRQGPSRSYPIAAHLKAGTVVSVDAVLTDEVGETIAGQHEWAHMAHVPDQQADMGFIHLSALKEVEHA